VPRLRLYAYTRFVCISLVRADVPLYAFPVKSQMNEWHGICQRNLRTSNAGR